MYGWYLIKIIFYILNSCPNNYRKNRIWNYQSYDIMHYVFFQIRLCSNIYPLNFSNFKLFDEKIAIVPGWAKWLCRSGRNCWSNLDLEGGGAWLSNANKSFWFSCVWFFNISICILKMEKWKKKSFPSISYYFHIPKIFLNFFPHTGKNRNRRKSNLLP